MLEGRGNTQAALFEPYTRLIVSSAHQDFAARAFELNAIDYLQAPVSYDRFLKCIDKVKEKFSRVKPCHQELPYFFVQSDGKGKLIRIAKDDIVFVESALNYLRIHLDKGSHLTYLSIKQMEETLQGHQFIRVHKSFIINLDKINTIEGNMIHLNNGKTIVLGPSYRRDFFDRIGLVLLRSKRQA
jgi:DNA-binding LytR/AlgR family response regulator